METYDVLISTDNDTSGGFPTFLFNSLEERGFRCKVVVDHRELTKEEIKGFRIFIIVLSRLYATCPFRLDKFTEIINEFGTPAGQWVFPVFYYVNVADVRHIKRSYEIALAVYKHFVEPERLKNWTEALNKVADFGGWPFKRSGDIYEYQYIDEIIQKVSEHVPCSIGLNCRVKKVNELLYPESDDGIQRVGIYGDAGIGKTTVARGVCHSNAGNRFDICILEKVGERLSNNGNGLADLIRMLLSEMLGNECPMFKNDEEGMSILKRIFEEEEEKKLFLVLEDIYDEKQLQVIVRLTNQFSSNSKVIITAEKDCFPPCGEIKKYEVEKFNYVEALEFLSLKVFNSKKLKNDYVGVLLQAETYASGNPFILEVIGSNLRGKSVEDCESALEQYEKIPKEEKQRIVKISFDALKKYHQEMLTQIAIFLNRQNLEMVEVEDKLCRHFDSHPKDGIKVLLDKSLIKINEHGLVALHNLTQNMIGDIA